MTRVTELMAVTVAGMPMAVAQHMRARKEGESGESALCCRLDGDRYLDSRVYYADFYNLAIKFIGDKREKTALTFRG